MDGPGTISRARRHVIPVSSPIHLCAKGNLALFGMTPPPLHVKVECDRSQGISGKGAREVGAILRNILWISPSRLPYQGVWR